jgi:hypothetical protein
VSASSQPKDQSIIGRLSFLVQSDAGITPAEFRFGKNARMFGLRSVAMMLAVEQGETVQAVAAYFGVGELFVNNAGGTIEAARNRYNPTQPDPNNLFEVLNRIRGELRKIADRAPTEE